MNHKFYLLYRLTSVLDRYTYDDGTEVPIVHLIKCKSLDEAMHVWDKRVSNFAGGPALLGYITDFTYLDYENYAPVLDDDLTK